MGEALSGTSQRGWFLCLYLGGNREKLYRLMQWGKYFRTRFKSISRHVFHLTDNFNISPVCRASCKKYFLTLNRMRNHVQKQSKWNLPLVLYVCYTVLFIIQNQLLIWNNKNPFTTYYTLGRWHRDQGLHLTHRRPVSVWVSFGCKWQKPSSNWPKQKREREYVAYGTDKFRSRCCWSRSTNCVVRTPSLFLAISWLSVLALLPGTLFMWPLEFQASILRA